MGGAADAGKVNHPGDVSQQRIPVQENVVSKLTTSA